MTKKPPRSFRLGATGQHPYGQIDESDEGELQLAITPDRQSGIVRIEFGKPIKWLGLSSRDARDVAALLIQKAEEVERSKA